MWTPPEARERRAAMAEEIAWQVTKRPYTYVLTDFVPMLRDRGVTDADLEAIFVDNPRRLLTGS
jgi:predicted metal-dependent phosphotriesterase family hydrolase